MASMSSTVRRRSAGSDTPLTTVLDELFEAIGVGFDVHSVEGPPLIGLRPAGLASTGSRARIRARRCRRLWRVSSLVNLEQGAQAVIERSASGEAGYPEAGSVR